VGGSALCGVCQSFCDPAASTDFGDQFSPVIGKSWEVGRALIAEGQAAGPKSRAFIYGNKRLEGNAISTIAAMLVPD
jgi:hypothetical protein